MTKYKYLIRSAIRFTTKKKCPFCGNKFVEIIDRKFHVTTLNECKRCFLYFRHPIDTINFNKKFYQTEYDQPDGITTDLPSDIELAKLVSANFLGTLKDATKSVRLIRILAGSSSNKRIIDYGASWGYTSYQFLKAGFDVQSYEISKPRALFGKKIQINILTDEQTLTGNVDFFFNSHVIEHLPDIKNILRLAQKLLTDDGYFVCFCPNGSSEFKRRNPDQFHKLWGQVHPNFLNAKFFQTIFKDVPYLIGSDLSTEDEIAPWNGTTQALLNLSGSELFVFAKIKKQLLDYDSYKPTSGDYKLTARQEKSSQAFSA